MIAATGLLLVDHARVHVFIPGASALRPAVMMGVLGLGALLLQSDAIRSVTRLARQPIARPAFCVAALALLGVPFSLSFGGSARFILDVFSRTFLAFLIIALAVRNVHDVRRLLAAFAIGVGVFAVMAPVSRGLGASVGGYDPNDSAMLLVSGLPLLAFFILKGRSALVRIGASIAVVATLVSIIDTQSRGGFLALTAIVAYMLFKLNTVRPAVRIAVVAGLVLVSVPVASGEYWQRMRTIAELDDGYGGEAGIGGRRNIWSRAIQYTLRNPLTGVGVNQFTRAEGQHPVIQARIRAGIGTKYSAPHSTWFQAMAELGIPGFIAFIAMFVRAAKMLWRVQTPNGRTGFVPPGMKPGELELMAGVLLASLLGLCVAGSFLTHAYSGMIWSFLAVVVGFAKVLPHGFVQPQPLRAETTRIGGSSGRATRMSHSGPLPRSWGSR